MHNYSRADEANGIGPYDVVIAGRAERVELHLANPDYKPKWHRWSVVGEDGTVFWRGTYDQCRDFVLHH